MGGNTFRLGDDGKCDGKKWCGNTFINIQKRGGTAGSGEELVLALPGKKAYNKMSKFTEKQNFFRRHPNETG